VAPQRTRVHGRPKTEIVTNPENTKIIPQSPDNSLSPPSREPVGKEQGPSAPIAKTHTLSATEIAEYKKVVPKNPAIVIGRPVFDAGHQYVGRVTQVNEAPHREFGSPVKEMRLYITIEDDSGAAQSIEYGRVEWRAASAEDNPKLGILLASASPDSPHQ
jgi:hypothetical protein